MRGELRLAGLACWAAAACGSEASSAARAAHKAERKGQVSQAFLLYSRASALQPKNRKFRAKAASLQTRALIASHVEPPPLAEPTEPDVLVEPAQYFDSLTARDFAAMRQPQPAPELKARAGRFDLNLQGNWKSLWTQTAQVYGLDVVFDGDFENGRPLNFHLDQADYREALHSLEAATAAFITPVSPGLFMVAHDIPAKRADLEQTVTVSIPVPQAVTSQELMELAQAVRQTLDIQKVAWDTKTNTVVIRDRVSRALPAQALFESLLNYRPQVMVELQLIEVRKSDIINYGINLPNMINVVFTGLPTAAAGTVVGSLPTNANNPFPFGSRSYQYLAQASALGSDVLKNAYRGLFPNSLSLFNLSVNEAQALANFSDSRSRTMLKTDLRASDAQPATFHLGDRYPIVTSSYSAGTAVQSGFTPVPSFTFEDLGITLKITPHVHGMEEVSLEVESEFKILTGQAVNGNPLIFNRKLNASVRLRDEEWALVAGLVSRTDSKETGGTAGFSQIPLVGHLFRKHTRQQDETQILILMKPRLLNLPGSETVTRAVRVGSETHPFIPF